MDKEIQKLAYLKPTSNAFDEFDSDGEQVPGKLGFSDSEEETIKVV